MIGKVMPLFFGKKFLSDPSRRNEVKEWKARIKSSDRKAMVKFGLGIFGRAGVYEELPKIQIPTLMIVGEEDTTPVEKAKRIAAKMPPAPNLWSFPMRGTCARWKSLLQ